MSAFNNVLFAMGVGRILLGVAPFVAAGPSAKLLGVADGENTATARLMGRFFGVRDVGLGVLTFWGLQHPEALPFILLFQALTDGGDLLSTAIPLLRREGIDRTAWTSAAFAGGAMLLWLTMFGLHRMAA